MSAHGVAGPRSVLTGPATRGGPGDEVSSAPPPEPDSPDAPAEPDPDESPRRDHLRLVEPGRLSPAQRRRRTRFAVAIAGAFLVAVVFGLVDLHVMLAQNQFRLDRLSGQASDQQARYERLRLHVDQLESPQRIVQAAEQKLGMVPPGSVTYLTPSAPLPVAPGPQPASTSHRTGSSSSTTFSSTTFSSTTLPATGAPADWPKVKSHLAASP